MKKLLKRMKQEEGFTLIEMTIVILVIAILLVVFLPNISGVNKNVNKTTDDALVQTVEAQKILYKAQEGKEGEVSDLVEKGYLTQKQQTAYGEYETNRKLKEGN